MVTSTGPSEGGTGMIDLHTHILPAIDDGSKDWDESLEMVREGANDGIKTIVATPHHMNGVYKNERNEIIELMFQLNHLIKEEGLDVKVLPGQEIRVYEQFVADLKKGRLLTFNDRHKYVFLEFPYDRVPVGADQLIFDIQLAGYVPIIPHPERNHDLRDNPIKLYNLVKRGALTQLTAGSLLGLFGKEAKSFSEEIIEYNLAHMIASDAHHVGKRGVKLSEAYQSINKMFGSQIESYFKENANSIIEGRDIYTDPPYKIEHNKGFFHFLKEKIL